MKKSLLILVGLLLVASLVFMGCKGGASKEEVVFRVINGAEPPSLDPSLSSDTTSHNILLALFEGLLIYDPKTNDGIPGMAESFEVSDDGKVYTFKLRKAEWSDGEKITAQTFVDSWLRTLNPDTASSYAWMMGMVVEGADAYNSGDAGPEAVQIRAVDDRTFEVTMVGPVPYVTSMLPHTVFGVLPMHVIEEHGEDWVLPENMVTNGAYTLDEWKPQEVLTVVKNPKYWDADAVTIDRIIYDPSDDNTTRLNMYLAGEGDWMNGGLPPDQLDAMKLRDDYQNVPMLGTYYYSLNNTIAPFNDVRVRKAMAMAIDKQTLVDRVSKGGQIPTDAFVAPMANYENAKGNSYDVEAAQQLLAEAGFPGGAGWPEITLTYNTSEGHKKIAEYVQQQWEENLGINVAIENVEWKTALSRGKKQEFQILRMGWIGDYLDPNTFLELFQTKSGQNYGKFSNEEFDRLIQEAARMPGGPERTAKLKRAEEIFVNEDQGIIPIYHYTNINMIDLDKWGGWYNTPTDWHHPKFIYPK
jgi:oligopeptide transport system substrate-binding protein